MATKLKVDREAIEMAMSAGPDEIEWFLDLHTGDLVPWEDAGITDIAEHMADPRTDAARYQAIEPLSSREAWQIRVEFAETVADDALRARLLDALDGRGAFQRFKRALAADVDEEQRWYRFEEERLVEAAREQLAQDGVEAEFVQRQ